MSADVGGIVARIDANPLGRIMFGQRELFHSNALAWFFDAFPASADEVFGAFTTPAATGVHRFVERERQHLDLVFHIPGRAPLVVENKVFAIPGLAQLNRYDETVAGWPIPPARVLLSMTPPEFDPPGTWRHIDWADLADRIDAALPTGLTYEVETMRRYTRLIRDLRELVAITEVSPDWIEEPTFLTAATLQPIGSSQMRSALHKARAQRVATWITEHIPAPRSLPSDFDPDPVEEWMLYDRYGTHWGLTNAQPLLDWFTLVHTDDGWLLSGWQYQSGQFRRPIIVLDPNKLGKAATARAARETIAARHPDLFTFPDGLPQAHGGRKAYNHYAPGFVYQYAKAPDLPLGVLLHAALDVRNEILAVHPSTW